MGKNIIITLQPLSNLMKLSISLNKPKAILQNQPVLRAPAFGVGAEDEDEFDRIESKAPVVQSSKAMRKRIDAEKRVDATVYEYDEVWDKMQEAKQRQQLAKEADTAARKPKYIQGLLASAATRRLDHLRAEEKMMQREREAEGDLYNHKESFVTQAYKDQMEEVRKAEEDEKKREEARKMQGSVSSGLTHFYRRLLEEDEQKHQEAVAATEKRIIGPQAGPNLTIVRPPDMVPLADMDLARLARAEGKEVEVNDDGQIVDKRELLSAGLNLSLPNTRQLGKANAATGQPAQSQTVQAHRAVGTAASRREINARRTREIQEQMAVEQERVGRQRQLEEEKATQRAIARRNNENDVESARARYLARKQRRLEGAQEHPESCV